MGYSASPADITASNTISGPDISTFKGEMVCNTPEPVLTDCVDTSNFNGLQQKSELGGQCAVFIAARNPKVTTV
jgi:hypothetical protein